MAKIKLHLEIGSFKVTRDGTTAIVERLGENAPIAEHALKQVVFVLEQSSHNQTFSMVRESNKANTISRPSNGWNQGVDWSEMIPTELRRHDQKVNGNRHAAAAAALNGSTRHGASRSIRHGHFATASAHRGAIAGPVPASLRKERRTFVFRPLPAV